jgi:hypothetical protein
MDTNSNDDGFLGVAQVELVNPQAAQKDRQQTSGDFALGAADLGQGDAAVRADHLVGLDGLTAVVQKWRSLRGGTPHDRATTAASETGFPHLVQYMAMPFVAMGIAADRMHIQNLA